MSAVLIARFIFELNGAPAGTVELSLDGNAYVYRSTHVYRRTKAERVDRFAADAKPVPEGLWLWRQPKEGCVQGVSELSHETGLLCVDTVKGHEVAGSSLGRAFTARYDERGELVELVIGKSRFVRSEKPLKPGQPYGEGFAIEGHGTRLSLDPPVEGTRWPELEPRGIRTAPAEEGACLELAQAFVDSTNVDYRLVLGLVVENGRAWPHAWAYAKVAGDVDPSAKKSEGTRPNRAYLELPADKAGALYVELLEGRRKLVWK
jgi:hypothetical protein